MVDPVTEESNIAREKRLFRLAAVEAIKNSHNAIKSVWTILFTGGTFALLNSFDHVVECSLVDPSERAAATVGTGFPCKDLAYLSGYYGFPIYLGLIVVYVATFYRFYVGNIRVFDIRYNEAIEFVKNLAAKRSETDQDAEYDWLLDYNDRWKKIENIYLMFKTLVIVYLTVSIANPLKFEVVYLLLLLMDILWIVSDWTGRNTRRLFRYVRRKLMERFCGGISSQTKEIEEPLYIKKFFGSFEKSRQKGQGSEGEKIPSGLEKMFPQAAFRIWGRNNSVFAVLLCIFVVPLGLCHLGVHVFESPISHELETRILIGGVLLMLGNCVFDLGLTWDFYNPPYSKLNNYLFGTK